MAPLPSTPPQADPLWTLQELHALVEAVLAERATGPDSGRVRAIPDERTLRYYTTIGLLAPPSVLKGRKAYYGRTHLAQIIAIKHLQALGLSLAQVQGELAGATPGELETLASLPEPLPEPGPAIPPPRDFWSEAPAPPARSALPSGTWLQLAPGVVVLLPAGAAPSPHLLNTLAQAAAPLAEELHRQGLTLTGTTDGDLHV